MGFLLFLGLWLVAVAPVAGQDDAADAPPTGLANSTELSLVVTEGNSNTTTFGLKNVLQYRWEAARFRLKLDAVRADSADDRFLLVEPGLTWLPGETPPVGTTSIVDPPVEPDFERYFLEGRYDKNFGARRTWHVGASWDRNEDAGILDRYIAFGGLGHVWRDRADLNFHTSYGLSFTDREEETPDPEKDASFAGVRFNWGYLNKFGKVTTYQNDFTANVNVTDVADYSLDMTNSIAVAMSDWLALKFSLQFLYNNEPALEDVDVIARTVLRDPDGIPGSGDEFFETVAEGGIEIEFGEEQIRKKPLDTVISTSLVINF